MRRPASMILVAFVACSPGNRDASTSATLADSAGVQIVSNTHPIGALPARATQRNPVMDIQTEEGGEWTIYEVTMVSPLPANRIGVSANGSTTALVFSSDGTLELALGRGGEGPGEFRSVEGVFALPGDSLGVYDPMARRLSVFTGSGVVGRTIDLAPLAPRSGWSRIWPLGGGFVLHGQAAFGTRPGPGTYRNRAPSYLISPAGDVLADFGEFPGLETFIGEGMMGRLPFGALAHATVSGDRFVLGTAEKPELRYYSQAGDLVRIVRWPDHDRVVTDSQVSEFVDAGLGEVPEAQRQTMRARLLALPHAELAPAYEEIVAADDGAVWVGNYPGPQPLRSDQPGPSREWLVVDGRGEIRERVETPAGFRLYAVQESTILGVYVDELGVESVRVYRLEEAPSAS